MALVRAKASSYVITDVEGRRLCTTKRIRYQLVSAENDECHSIDKICTINESVSIPP